MLMEAAGLFTAQSRRLFKFRCSVPTERELLLEQFTGTEALSEVYRYDIQLLCEHAGIEFALLRRQRDR